MPTMWRESARQRPLVAAKSGTGARTARSIAELLTISAVHDAQGRPQHYVALFSDITAIKEHQSQLEHIAHFDALTNLPNRVLLADRLQQAMAQAAAQPANPGGGLPRPGWLQDHQRPAMAMRPATSCWSPWPPA